MQAGRVIKFRGKRIDNGEWVYGGVLQSNDFTAICKYSDYHNWHEFIEVEPKSVGQFTGLHDKNGKEIYEGDRMYAAGNIEGEECIGTVEWDNEDARFEVVGLHGRFEYIPRECYVKGNKFEPEM